MGFKAAIFDFDGTIADSMSMWADFAFRFVTYLGGKPREGVSKTVNSMSVAEAEVYLRQEYFPHYTAEEMHKATELFVLDRYTKGFEPKEGIAEFVKELSERGILMAIATATDRKPVSIALSKLGLAPYFEHIVTCTDAGVGKSSSPAVFDLTLSKLGAIKEDTIIFEDSFYAAKTAAAAGYCVAGIYDDFSSSKKEQMKSVCRYYFDDFKEAKKELL